MPLDSGALSYTGTNAGPYHIELGTLAAGSNFELKLDTTPVNFEIKQAEQTITGDDFSARNRFHCRSEREIQRLRFLVL